MFHLLKISLTELDFFSPSFYSSIQFSYSVVSDSLRPPWTAARQASVSITNSRSLFKLMSMKSMMSSNHLILCHLFLLLPSIFPSIRVFTNKSALRTRWPKYWSFSFISSPSHEYPGLISFRFDWFGLLAVQGTLKSPPAPKVKGISSSLLSFFYCPALIYVHDYWKNHSFGLYGHLKQSNVFDCMDIWKFWKTSKVLEKPKLWLYGHLKQSNLFAF